MWTLSERAVAGRGHPTGVTCEACIDSAGGAERDFYLVCLLIFLLLLTTGSWWIAGSPLTLLLVPCFGFGGGVSLSQTRCRKTSVLGWNWQHAVVFGPTEDSRLVTPMQYS